MRATMYNPFMMNPMGGGGMDYWSPQRMQNAQPMGGYGGPTGADREGMGWRQSRREQQGQLGQQQGRMDNMPDRMGRLQEQYKGASSTQQAGIQARMDRIQGNMDKVQGNMGDPNATGANRAGMGWRQERRQAKNAGTYDPQAQDGAMPEPAMMRGGFNPYGGMGGMGFGGQGWGGGGGMNWNQPMGGWNMPQNGGGWQSGGGMNGMGEMAYRPGGFPQMGMMPPPQYRTQEAGQNQNGAAPVAPYNPQAQPQQGGGWNPLTTPTGMGNMFETQFGRLVPSSVGNQNVFQREGDASTLYNYNPTQGWKSMTPDEYRGYGETNYADPRQFGAAANPMMQQWTRGPGGMIQGMVGTGAYA